MKKALFISTRNPFSKRYSGDIIGSKGVIKNLKRIYSLDIVSLGNNEDLSKKNIFIFKSPSFFLKIFNVIKSLIKFKPMQYGVFYSYKMKKFIDENADNYDLIFFYHIRSSQYLPKYYRGKKIIEMGDLYSSNYIQTYKNLNILNPLRYIYLFESFFVKKAETQIFLDFDKIILFSKNEIKKIDRSFKKKIYQINISVDKLKDKFRFSKNNNKILFIGNLKYLPNYLAVKDFIKNVLPKIKYKFPLMKLEIIGEIRNYDKFLLSLNKSINCLGPKKRLDKFIKGSICGLANLRIATGIQGKVLTYMSYGLPVICSKIVAANFSKSVLTYNNNKEFIKKLETLKNNNAISNKLRKNSKKLVKNFSQEKINQSYLKIIKV